MKLTEDQINELIAEKKAYLQKQGLLESENISRDVEAWCNADEIEKFAADQDDLWHEIDALIDHTTDEQVGRYIQEVRLEIFKAIAREVRIHNPLLAAAFDATK